MKKINDYRNRFVNLLESTMGNVKPLISESGGYQAGDTNIIKNAGGKEESYRIEEIDTQSYKCETAIVYLRNIETKQKTGYTVPNPKSPTKVYDGKKADVSTYNSALANLILQITRSNLRNC
jgi:hypothetical protein